MALALDLPIALERTAPTPMHQQLCEQLRRAILDGRLTSDTRLPSTRTLAQALGVSRTVTSAAYDELLVEGYLEGLRGSGTYVGTDLPHFHPRLDPCRPPHRAGWEGVFSRHLPVRSRLPHRPSCFNWGRFPFHPSPRGPGARRGGQ